MTNPNHSYQITVPPLPAESRPLWSVMIPTYNCAHYLRETLASVLSQDPGIDKMQIAVIDDGSTKDDPKAVVEELGQGRVEFYRQPQNVGYIRNFETCLLRSRGHLVHLLHGDDGVREGFYQKLGQAFHQAPEIGAAFCRHIGMDEAGHWLWISDLERQESGILENGLERLAVRQRIQTPSIAVRREVYETLGGFDRRFTCCGEDWEMWVRIAAHYPIWHEVEPLALYRIHANSLSRLSTRSGADLRDLRLAIDLMHPYLPPTTANQLTAQAQDHWARFALRTLAPQMLAQGDTQAAYIQLQEALRCSRSIGILKEAIKLSLRLSRYKLHSLSTRLLGTGKGSTLNVSHPINSPNLGDSSQRSTQSPPRLGDSGGNQDLYRSDRQETSSPNPHPLPDVGGNTG